MLSVVLRDVALDGALVDVGIVDQRIVAVGRDLGAACAEVPGNGRRVLPGLHDHHLHLDAWAAALSSVDCSRDLAALSSATPDASGWVRGVGAAQAPDRQALDRVRDNVPVRVQHRGGAAWSLNSAALDLVATALEVGPAVERDDRGLPTGRLYRLDAGLRDYFGNGLPDLRVVVSRLQRYGVTGVTDATPNLDESTVARLSSITGVSVTLLGGQTGTCKLLIDDHDLPSWEQLCTRIASLHNQDRPVAVHCVTRTSLLLTVAVLEHVGSLPGDRIEHASVVPLGTEKRLADLGVAVVTQPSFLRLRGDDYLREVDPPDQALLYPYRRLVDAGVRVAASSDAPYGDPDPWASIADASARTSREGIMLVPQEAVDQELALRGFLSPAHDPGGAARTIAIGQPADLCVLDIDNRASHVVVAGTVHAVTDGTVE